MKKTKHQRSAYALRRLSMAVDRMIVAKTAHDKQRAQFWANAWALRFHLL
jgi:hypothetical protein